MRQFKLKGPKRERCKRVVVACLLLSLLVGITGLPMPVSKSTNERFPCEKCPCGCHSAAHCWDKCCCHSDEEKLAWAKANGVTPPVFLVQRVATSKGAKLASVKKSPACCAATSSATASAATGALNCKAHASVQSCSACAKQPASERGATSSTKTASGTKLVLLDPFLNCQGSGKLWKLLQSVYVSTNIALQLDVAHALPEYRPLENIYAASLAQWPDGPVPKYF